MADRCFGRLFAFAACAAAFAFIAAFTALAHDIKDEEKTMSDHPYVGMWVTADHIGYKDDTGFTADGGFRDGVFYHAGMVLRRR